MQRCGIPINKSIVDILCGIRRVKRMKSSVGRWKGCACGGLCHQLPTTSEPTAAQIFSRCFRSAMATASARLAAPSLEKMAFRCSLTTVGQMPS